MNVEPIPGELGRFYVDSKSRPGMKHLVDLRYRGESGNDKPKPACLCEENHIKGNMCQHIRAAVIFELMRLGLIADTAHKPKKEAV